MRQQTEPNTPKLRALKTFAKNGKQNPPAWAVLSKFFPIRSAYTYLLRLHRFGLLHSSRDSNGLLVYSLSPRGRARLAWLQDQMRIKTETEDHKGREQMNLTQQSTELNELPRISEVKAGERND